MNDHWLVKVEVVSCKLKIKISKSPLPSVWKHKSSGSHLEHKPLESTEPMIDLCRYGRVKQPNTFSSHEVGESRGVAVPLTVLIVCVVFVKSVERTRWQGDRHCQSSDSAENIGTWEGYSRCRKKYSKAKTRDIMEGMLPWEMAGLRERWKAQWEMPWKWWKWDMNNAQSCPVYLRTQRMLHETWWCCSNRWRVARCGSNDDRYSPYRFQRVAEICWALRSENCEVDKRLEVFEQRYYWYVRLGR